MSFSASSFAKITVVSVVDIVKCFLILLFRNVLLNEGYCLTGNEEDSMKLFCSQNDDSPTTKDGTGEKRGSGRKQEVDRFGYYQMIMFAIISLPLFLSAGFTLAYVFTAGEVKYRCAVPECENPLNTKFDVPWMTDSVPHVSEMSKCTRYVVRNHTGVCTNQTFSNATQKCESWVYEPSENTVLSEWDLTCDANRWKLTLVGTINNVGQFVGLIFAGYISDKYGRRTILTLTTFLSGISGLIHSFSVNYWMFLAFEFIDATVAAGIYSAGFILGMEMAGVKGRVLASTIICCLFAVGEMLLGLIAMWLRSWRVILRMVYGPALLAILLPVMIPESVRKKKRTKKKHTHTHMPFSRWLLANGKHEKVESIYRKMARINGLQISEEALGAFKDMNMVKSEKIPFFQLHSRTLHKICTKIRNLLQNEQKRLETCIKLNTRTMAFRLSDGAAGDRKEVTGDANFEQLGDDYTAAGLLVLLADQHFRGDVKWANLPIAGSMSFLPLVLYLGGKWCITMSFSTIYIYTTELFPTNLRHSLLGICSMTGRMGSILSPQTPLLVSPTTPQEYHRGGFSPERNVFEKKLSSLFYLPNDVKSAIQIYRLHNLAQTERNLKVSRGSLYIKLKGLKGREAVSGQPRSTCESYVESARAERLSPKQKKKREKMEFCLRELVGGTINLHNWCSCKRAQKLISSPMEIRRELRRYADPRLLAKTKIEKRTPRHEAAQLSRLSIDDVCPVKIGNAARRFELAVAEMSQSGRQWEEASLYARRRSVWEETGNVEKEKTGKPHGSQVAGKRDGDGEGLSKTNVTIWRW
ncbi:Solute carrier family 22 member 21 [Melipona quadrifasciata]|uniref:Solute carrier family 22 member 21 n=1 Tax=Melipona quadrifasciata TaxID=166423 RepID=A0A0M9A8D9_9HYME|nr:Solute carrier family 22 member 21 [Melipona quadrifasciata]